MKRHNVKIKNRIDQETNHSTTTKSRTPPSPNYLSLFFSDKDGLPLPSESFVVGFLYLCRDGKIPSLAGERWIIRSLPPAPPSSPLGIDLESRNKSPHRRNRLGCSLFTTYLLFNLSVWGSCL